MTLTDTIVLPEIKNPLWQWQSCQGLPYLTCSLLADWSHGFFSQYFFPTSPENLTPILAKTAKSYYLKQVHGNLVVNPSDQIMAADGLISDQPQQALWVASADCTPILIASSKTGQVAALHAGWRGTAQSIVKVAISRFVTLGNSLSDLSIAMGPAIAGDVYQVTKAVAAQICSSLFSSELSENPEEVLRLTQTLPTSPLKLDPQPGRIKIDIPLVNSLQLQQLGINSEQIAIAPYCTYQNPELFFSYRRTREKQVQWSGIVSGLVSYSPILHNSDRSWF